MAAVNLIGSYNYALVALSVLIAIFASYAALNLAGRVTAAGGWTRAVWLLGGAGAMGTGIWSMHYIGMLAFILPIPVAYHWPTVLQSLLAAILASVVALEVVSRQKMGAFRALAGSVLMGAGISSMHYIGMAAMRLPAVCQFNSFLVVLSVVFAVLISLAALWITFHFRDEKKGIGWEKLAGAVVMGAAIPVMHYTGMAAASFTPSGMPADLSHAVSISTLGTAGIAAVTFIVLGLALLTSWMDRRFAAQTLELQEERLEQSEHRFRDLVNSVEGIVWEAEVPSFQFLFISKQAERILGYPVERWLSEPTFWKDHVHPEDREWALQFCQTATAEKRDHDFEYRMIAADGSVVWLHDRVTVVVEGDRVTRARGVMVDLTNRKQAEEGLRQAQADLAHVSRVSTMGELTASLAHEINQPIAAAVTNANTCLRWLAANPPNVEEACAAAMRIVKDGKRAAEIISRIRLLFEEGAPERELIDVNEVIQEMIVLLRSEAMRYSIAVRTELAAELPQVMGDRVQLQQVLMNLMLNGIDAMKDMDAGGELTIKSQQAENGELLISVTDTGVGLPTQQEEIFNAFFTTKPHGTGMGLSISRSIVESHGGRLWAADSSPHGASFYFTLPSKAEAHA
jgi:PAS domain S-box-containing protein